MAEKTIVKAEEKGFLRKIIPIAGRVAFLLAVMFLGVYLFTVLTGSADFFTSSAERSALVSFDDDMERAEALADIHYGNLYAVAEQLRYAKSPEEVREITKSYIGTDFFGNLRYYSQGLAYSADGAPVIVETNGDALIEELSKSHKQGCTPAYFDSTLGHDCIAFFVPVRGSVYVDGVLSILPTREVIPTKELIASEPKLSLSLIIDKGGKVYSAAAGNGFGETVGPKFFEFIDGLTYDKNEVNAVSRAVASGERTACSIKTLGAEYVLVMSPIPAADGNLILISMSISEGLIAPEMVYIRHIVNLVVIAVVAIIIGFIYAVCYYKASQKAIAVASYTDPLIGCPNAEQFRISVEKLLADRRRKYVLAAFDIRQFHYMKETLTEDEVNETLKFVAKVFETFTSIRETYGYLGEGKFAILIDYETNKTVKDKIRLIETVAAKNEAIGGKNKKLFDVGVCLAFELKRHSSASELISHANVACDKAKTDINKQFVMYTEQVNLERERDERIEAEMENALATGEFRLFLQPKYNVANDKIDSAEALVRWFDPKTGDYRFPGEFISLFESNGFITKLDHFMYIEVLKCVSAAAERGERVVPVSVNVSLVTASAPDFLDFYIENKKKYRVGDDFIMVEFTESFAVGDHERLRDIVTRLHQNGIRCSLDDFGTGYASFNVLKNIPVDELKLDRMFLSPGYKRENDDTLHETVIRLAKALGIRVVQEGVETREMFESAVEKGCDVIQGYYYAKAIPAEEYRLFIGSNTSIKYKSRVK